MADPITIYHNQRCSKSRETPGLLRERGVEPRVVNYLETPPSAEELEQLLGLLGLEPRELMRRGEAVYKELDLANPAISRAQLVAAMVANPILIERPIVVGGGQAVIGRPPERVLALL